MTQTFLIESGAATMTSDTRSGGSCLEIACKSEGGEEVRMRLLFTDDGIDRFAELVNNFARSAQRARAQDGGAGRTPAAEPTSGAAASAESEHIERYMVTHMPESEVRKLRDAIDPFRETGRLEEEFRGQNRVVAWQVRDSRAERPDDPGYRIYLSQGALRAARRSGVHLEVEGELSRLELPHDRELLIGNAALDWQDTTY